ncbi:unnamed protein product [Urochloa decumbens]|uniref:Uncharacterized protein n=1 Tax=Urochloa decumbens TaxID=240449 RepID=A0ABC9EK26_9POAL
MLARRLPCSPRSQRAWIPRATTGASAATDPSAQRQQHVDEEGNQISRNISNFEPSIWGDFFLTYSSPLASPTQQEMIERAEHLKERVSKTISASSSNCSLYERMELIDALERVCLDHLFKEEINVLLTEINDADISGCDLQTVALWFFLLSKHGYQVSPDVFSNFRDEQGSFAANNPMDLLSLYNAACLRPNGEIILDEAVSFTKRCLESILDNIEGPFAREVKCALEIPASRRVRIYEAKYYVSGHGEGYEVIMELAKLNFNIIQLQHQQELKIITRWWKGLELQSRLSFARDRVVECYFWVVGVYYEPSYSRGRIILTKIIDLVRAYNKEVKWREEGYVPATIEEHLHVSARSGACHLLSCTSFIGMRDIATEEAFDWVSNVPKLVKALCIILRLSDDLKSYEREKMTCHVASTIDSCMKEHGVTVEVAREKIHDMIEETWKDFNEEWLNINNRMPKELLERIFNLTRTMVFMYNQDDAYTNSVMSSRTP